MSESELLPTPPTSEDELLAAYYHEQYPGLTKEFFGFLKNVSQMEREILPVARIIIEHQSQFESNTVVFTRHELFTHLCSRGYTPELATFLTEEADEDIIPHWTLAQWTVAFLSYATKSWAEDVAAGVQDEPAVKKSWASVVAAGGQAKSQNSNQIQPRKISSSVPIRSLSRKDVHISDLGQQLEKIRKESPHLVLFHFTTKRSAASIQGGIDLRESNRYSEFAVLGAFYLSDSIEFGLKWLRTRHRSMKGAVLVFEMPDSYFLRHRCVRLESANDDWKKFCYNNFNQDPRRRQKQQMEIFIDPNIATIQGPSYYDRTAQTGRLQNYGFQGQYVGAGVAQLDTMNQAPTLNTSIVSAFKDALARRFGRAA